MKTGHFKIIAIRPLVGCHADYLKVLAPNQIYYLHNSYTIQGNDHVSYVDTLPSDFYESSVGISICAIVGKNGSGKSTIIELLFRAINNISKAYHIITADLKSIPHLHIDLYFHTDKIYKVRVNNYTI